MTRCLVTGAGGAIGGHLVNRLIEEGHDVTAVDKKQYSDWYQQNEKANNVIFDLSYRSECHSVTAGMQYVYNLAADMGGLGFITSARVETMHSVDITSNMIRAAYDNNVDRYFYASSACVYPDYKQQTELVSLKESDAWPADPEPAYGLEKLYGEEFCHWYHEQLGLTCRVARFHNVYGPNGTYDGGREKAPAAICRKVIQAKLSGDHTIEIWGDGEQTRSFMYVDDCIEGTRRIMDSDIEYPINLGSSELVSINQLVDIVEDIAEIRLTRTYNLDAPQGVRGRNSCNDLIKQELGWEPSISLREGLEATYAWIYDQLV